jgi:hypothetical protein
MTEECIMEGRKRRMPCYSATAAQGYRDTA